MFSCILPCIRLMGRRYLFGGEVLGISLVLVIVLVLVHQFEHDPNKHKRVAQTTVGVGQLQIGTPRISDRSSYACYVLTHVVALSELTNAPSMSPLTRARSAYI